MVKVVCEVWVFTTAEARLAILGSKKVDAAQPTRPPTHEEPEPHDEPPTSELGVKEIPTLHGKPPTHEDPTVR